MYKLSRRIGKILVEFDLQKGLPKFLEIEWRWMVHTQKLDYWGISFHGLQGGRAFEKHLSREKKNNRRGRKSGRS
jgi:hypothetical protein